MRAELWISRNKSPLTYFKICQRRIEENNEDDLVLIALEGAIIQAVDTANMLVRAKLVKILKIETDSVEVNTI
jgi:DNA-binding protein